MKERDLLEQAPLAARVAGKPPVVRIDLLTPAGAPLPAQATVFYRDGVEDWKHAMTIRKVARTTWMVAESSLGVIKAGAYKNCEASWVWCLQSAIGRLLASEGNYPALGRSLQAELGSYNSLTGNRVPASRHEGAGQ